MLKHSAWLAAATVICLGSSLVADDKPAGEGQDAGDLFGQLDTNKDGQLADDEIPEDRKGLFERLVRIADKNGDGKLTSDEFAAGLKPRAEAADDSPAKRPRPEGKPDGRNAERLFKRLDSNSDGKVMIDEVPEERRVIVVRMLKRAKKGNDEGLTVEDFRKALADRAESEGKPGKPGRPGQGAFPPGGPPRGGLFAAFDTDHDGKLSASEISGAADVLKKLDTNGDGEVTLNELMVVVAPSGADK